MDPTPDRLAAGLARAVKTLRDRRGFSLDVLAARSGVSKGMLVQVEKARVNPSLGTLVRIADALGTTVGRLIEAEDRSRVQVRPVSEQKALWRGKGRSAACLLGASDRVAHVESWRWLLAPGEGYESHAHPKGSEEHLFVLQGTLSLTAGREEVAVREGASVVFDADQPHAYRNASRRQALSFVMFVVTPYDASARGRRTGRH